MAWSSSGDAPLILSRNEGRSSSRSANNGAGAAAVDDAQVGVTDARHLDAHEQLAGAGRVELQFAHDERAR